MIEPHPWFPLVALGEIAWALSGVPSCVYAASLHDRGRADLAALVMITWAAPSLLLLLLCLLP